MKKVMCIKCGDKRGRRWCPKFGGLICGDCCSTTQLNYTCPKNCSNFGKLNVRDYKDKIDALLEIGTGTMDINPREAIKIFDRVLELDGGNYRGYVEKGTVYENLGQLDMSIECLDRAYSINEDRDLYLNLISVHVRAGHYKRALEMLENIKDGTGEHRVYYLLGQCFYMTGRFEDAAENMKKAVECKQLSGQMRDEAYITLAWSYLMIKNADQAVESALAIGEGHDSERNEVLENAYFAGGRMYELLRYIDSIEDPTGLEKYMLLQCSLVLNKNSHGSIIKIIDDILSGGFYSSNEYRKTQLIALKIKLMFKELDMGTSYELFMENEEKLLSYIQDIPDCSEDCALIAFFLYSIDREKAISLFSKSMGYEIGEFLMDELYNAFTTMDISPYMAARCVQKSFRLMKDGKRESFSRTAVAADLLFEDGDYSRAAELYNRLIDESRPDAMTLYRISVCLIHQGKYAEAQRTLDTVISQTKFIPGVNPAMVMCALEIGIDWTEYYDGCEVEKLNFSTIYELAEKLCEKGYFDRAGYLYSFIIEKFKNMDIYSRGMVYHNMVSIYRSLHEYDKALQLLDQIPYEYRGFDILVDLGCIYCDMGRMKDSMDIFHMVKPGCHEWLIDYNTGILQMKIGNIDEALKSFKASIEDVKSCLKNKGPMHYLEYRNILERIYRNTSLCHIIQGNSEYALLYCERASNADGDSRTGEVISFVKDAALHPEDNSGPVKGDAEKLMDGCIGVCESFTEEIKTTLNNIYGKFYGNAGSAERPELPEDRLVGEFIDNEIKVYSRNRASIERSEGTFQRYMDNLMDSFERRVIRALDDKFPSQIDPGAPLSEILDYCSRLVDFGSGLIEKLQYSGTPGYIYAALVPYYRAVKILVRSMVQPYFKKSIDILPVPDSPESFGNIGVYCHKSYDDTLYRIDFPFDISTSKYLFEINCHPGLRDRYFNYKRHYMPWNKLIWMISGIKKRWDVVDDARACGLLLLFYSGYNNYLCIESSLSREDIINLSGDLIQLSNERDFSIRGMLEGSFEIDCNGQAENIRDIALRCINGLTKIRLC